VAPLNSLIKKQIDNFRLTFFDNSLFHYRLQRFSIYTWFNLAVLFTLLLIIFCTFVRYLHYLEAQELLAAYPDYQRALMVGLFADRWEFSFIPTIPEGTWMGVQYGAFVLLYLLFMLSVARDLWLWHKPRWDHPESLHVRILPVNPSQAQFALADLRFYAMSLCILFCTCLFLLPAIDLRSYVQDQFLLDLKLNKYALNTIWLWVVVFAGYRTIQFQKHRGINIIANPMFGRWLIAFLFWIAFTQVLCIVWATIFDEIQNEPNSSAFDLRLSPLFHYSAIAACLLLLISCWTLKHHLYREQKE
jgi:hypothetical protein